MDEDDCSIFISHAAADQKIAISLKSYISKALPTLSIFVSSDPGDLKLGDPWVTKILRALETTTFVIFLATARGLDRKWVWFEAGRTWFSGVKLLPCCLGIVRKSELPAPFSGIMSANLDEEIDIRLLFEELERMFGKLSLTTNYSEVARSMTRLDIRAEERCKVLEDPLLADRMKIIERKINSLSKAERETIRHFVIYGTLSTAAARTAVRETGVDMESWSVPLALVEKTGWIEARLGNAPSDNFGTNQFCINPTLKPFIEKYFAEAGT